MDHELNKKNTSLNTNTPQSPISETPHPLRALPAVHAVMDQLVSLGWRDRTSREALVQAARRAIAQERQSVGASVRQPKSTNELALDAQRVLESASRSPLAPVINATGVLLHTGLGRAPMARRAIDAMSEVAGAYASVELDLATGKRGNRAVATRSLLCDLTGAESATVVNNGAAALTLVVTTLAKERDVIVSRGELIEIGGSFRLPDIIESGGAHLCEVGTTNRTRPGDYENAINDDPGMILKIHPSNYKIAGFTESASVESLASIARVHNLPLVHDIGSGVLNDTIGRVLGVRDPNAKSSIEAGADLVLFSGDKLLGGPQAGVIVGRERLIDRLERSPMMRAFRVDKMTLAALRATLEICSDGERLTERLPVAQLLKVPMDRLAMRGKRIATALRKRAPSLEARVIETSGLVGGGSAPGASTPSVGVEIHSKELSETVLSARLRHGSPTVIGRINQGAITLDLRTIFEKDDDQLIDAVTTAAAKPSDR